MICCYWRQRRETSVEIKRQNAEVVTLTGEQLIRKIRLFGAVPWWFEIANSAGWHYKYSTVL